MANPTEREVSRDVRVARQATRLANASQVESGRRLTMRYILDDEALLVYDLEAESLLSVSELVATLSPVLRMQVRMTA